MAYNTLVKHYYLSGSEMYKNICNSIRNERLSLEFLMLLDFQIDFAIAINYLSTFSVSTGDSPCIDEELISFDKRLGVLKSLCHDLIEMRLIIKLRAFRTVSV